MSRDCDPLTYANDWVADLVDRTIAQEVSALLLSKEELTAVRSVVSGLRVKAQQRREGVARLARTGRTGRTGGK